MRKIRIAAISTVEYVTWIALFGATLWIVCDTHQMVHQINQTLHGAP